MTDSDRPRLAKILMMLGEAFREPVSDVRAEAYFLALGDLPIDGVESAAKHTLRYSKFFPRPSELREILHGSAADGAELAWMGLLNEIRRVGYMRQPELPASTIDVVNALWGGWRNMCATMPGEGPEALGCAKQFKAAYTAMRSAHLRHELPAGAPPLLFESE